MKPEEKDIQRIKDLFIKSKGSDDKLLQLAKSMADKIDDAAKVFRRGLAADQLIGPDENPLSQIFYDRAKELGYDISEIPATNPKYNSAENKKGVIYLPTWSAIALWEHELTGQFSDGMWENDRDQSKWQFWNGLTVKRGQPELQYWGWPKRGYNVLNKELLDIVGDRMICIGRMAKALNKQLTYEEAYAAMALEGIDTIDEIENKSSYLTDKYLKKLPQQVLNKYFATKYDHKDMIADLKIIKQAMSSHQI